MLELLDNPTFDNERNVLNADLFVSNLKNTLKGFDINPKITYEVYRNYTFYHVTWNSDKTYEDILQLDKEIALALGVVADELNIKKISDNEIEINVSNMKREPLTLKELLSDYKKDNKFKIVLGLNEKDEIISFDLNKDKNLLVTGVSGTGKTNLFNNIIMNVLINYPKTKLVILDSQSINYNDYSDLCTVVNDEKEIIKTVKILRHDFEERVKNDIHENIIVLIDEVYEIIKMDNSVKDDINYLLELGSTYGIHLIVSTDTILDNDIYRLFNRNLCKLSFYQTSRSEYNMFLNEPELVLEQNEAAYLNKKLTKLNIPLIKDEEIERITTYLKSK